MRAGDEQAGKDSDRVNETVQSVSGSVQAAWAQVAHAAVVTEGMAEASLAELESSRVQYRAQHRAAAERIAAVALELSRPDLSLRARLILADLELRQGRIVSAAEKIKIVLAAAEDLGETYVMARSHSLLCTAQHSLGDSPSARINGIRSIELLPDDAPISVRIDHLRALGTAYGPGPESERVHAQALDLVYVIGDAGRAIAIHNSLAYFAYQTDDFPRATEHVDEMLELSRVRHIPLVATQLDTVARVLMMSSRYEEAIEVMRPLIPRASDPTRAGGVDDVDPKPYGLAECMLTVAEAHRALGRYATAQQALNSAFQLGAERHLGRFRTHARLTQAALYSDLGDYRRAYYEHIAFHAAVRDLQSDEHEMRARLIQASYDAGEQRRDVERFRELALRDALTGLHNRRFLDEALQTRVALAAERSEQISVAIADADFFKRINDELSHEVGDEVLRHLAAILAAGAVPPEVVGRLGGEEFLIVLPNADAGAAFERCETIRRTVADYDFRQIAGHVPVTISIGAATAWGADTSPTALLAEADRNLYAAKASGRNCVMPPAVVATTYDEVRGRAPLGYVGKAGPGVSASF